MKKILLVTLLAFGASSALACEKIKVGGLHCDACKDTIEGAFKEKPEVQAVNVDVKSGWLTLTYKSGQTLSETSVKDLVKSKGFKTESACMPGGTAKATKKII